MDSGFFSLAFWTPGPIELFVILLVALLLFGKRLPEVGKSLGKGLVEFKRGISGIEEEFDQAAQSTDAGKSSNAQGQHSGEGPGHASGGGTQAEATVARGKGASDDTEPVTQASESESPREPARSDS